MANDRLVSKNLQEKKQVDPNSVGPPGNRRSTHIEVAYYRSDSIDRIITKVAPSRYHCVKHSA